MQGIEPVLFVLFSLITLGAAIMVATRRNIFHAALFLILSFFGVAGIYVVLEAPFLAAVQLFIYIGGIAVLIVFAVMLTRRMMNPKEEPFNQQWWIAAIAAVALFAVLGLVVLGHEWDEAAGSVPDDSIQVLGRRLLEPQGFVLPFEVASVLLVAALVGAVTIARERR